MMLRSSTDEQLGFLFNVHSGFLGDIMIGSRS
jgi:hypothetical protein